MRNPLDNHQNITGINPVIVAPYCPCSLACIRSWGRVGLKVGIISIQKETEPMPYSSYLSDSVILPPEKLLTDDGMNIIIAFLKKFKASGITCVSENVACWINDNRTLLSKHTMVWFPENETIRNILSKRNQIDIARAVGFQVLPTYFISRQENADIVIPPEDFPLCLRPDGPETVEPHFKVSLVQSREELFKYLGSIKEVRVPIIAQPFRNIPNLVVHGCRTRSGESLELAAFIVRRKFEGITLTLEPFELPDDLRKKCIAFVNSFMIIGNYHYEFLFDPVSQDAFFLELNGRFGGTTAKVCACGYDEPILALQAYGVPLTYQPEIIPKIISSKSALVGYLIDALRNKLNALDYFEQPLWKRIPETLFGIFFYKDEIFDIRDISGSFSAYCCIVRKFINKFRLKIYQKALTLTNQLMMQGKRSNR